MKIQILNDKNEVIAEAVEFLENPLDFHAYRLNTGNKKQGEVTVHCKKGDMFTCSTWVNLLDWTEKESLTAAYSLVGGVRVPINGATHERRHYFKRIGWFNMTVAEAILFCELVEYTT